MFGLKKFFLLICLCVPGQSNPIVTAASTLKEMNDNSKPLTTEEFKRIKRKIKRVPASPAAQHLITEKYKVVTRQQEDTQVPVVAAAPDDAKIIAQQIRQLSEISEEINQDLQKHLDLALALNKRGMLFPATEWAVIVALVGVGIYTKESGLIVVGGSLAPFAIHSTVTSAKNYIILSGTQRYMKENAAFLKQIIVEESQAS